MTFLAWFALFAALALYIRFIWILFKHFNESKKLKIFYSISGFFLTFLIAKLIQIILDIVPYPPNAALENLIWFSVTIGLIIICEAVLRMIITKKDFHKIQSFEKQEKFRSLIHRVDESVKKGNWNQAHQLYFEIELLDLGQIRLKLKCMDMAEQNERVGNMEAAQFWYKKAEE